GVLRSATPIAVSDALDATGLAALPAPPVVVTAPGAADAGGVAHGSEISAARPRNTGHLAPPHAHTAAAGAGAGAGSGASAPAGGSAGGVFPSGAPAAHYAGGGGSGGGGGGGDGAGARWAGARRSAPHGLTLRGSVILAHHPA